MNRRKFRCSEIECTHETLNDETAITLIALIITIIVLLILARNNNNRCFG